MEIFNEEDKIIDTLEFTKWVWFYQNLMTL
jgi:hypothetical protein